MPAKNVGRDPLIGIIMLDTIFPRIPGDIGNPNTFSFPVLYETVKGASSKRVVIDADPLLLQPFIQAARTLECEGVQAITTSCGFLALFHRELADAVDIPVFTSSLLQVHFLKSILKKNQKIGIITALSKSLTQKHLAGVGIQSYPLAIIGMDTTTEFKAAFVEGKEDIDIDKCRQEILSVAKKLVRSNPDVSAVILECTNMPPFAKDIQTSVGLPVFDVVTMINYVYSSINHKIFK